MDHEVVKRFQGFDFETSKTFWHKALELYLGTTNADKIREVEDKARIVGYTRMIRRSIRRKGLETEQGRKEIEHWKKELLELIDKYDTLLFSVNELVVEAKKENLQNVIDFVDEHLEKTECPMKAEMQIDMAVEEIFVNIASYAYAHEDNIGKAVIRVETLEDPLRVVLTFMDNGMPYDPLAKEDPDVTLGADEREIGGLGIFLVKNTMDDVTYEYKDGRNILTIRKNL